MGHQEEALNLFLTENIEEARQITIKLNQYNRERQEKEKKIIEESIEQIEKNNDVPNTFVLAQNDWHHGVIGIVSSKITEKYFKPSILISLDGDEGKGSGRSIPGFDLFSTLSECKEYLEKFGGHEMAIGLTIKKDNIEKFKNKFEKLATQKNISDIIPIINLDGILTLKDINKKTIQDIKLLEPFGEANKIPMFVYKNLKIDSIRALTEGKHLKLTLKDSNYIINAIGFNLGYMIEDFKIGDKVDIAGTLEINNYNGYENIQINLKDIMKSI